MRPITADHLAARILISTDPSEVKQARLADLAAVVRDAAASRVECPDCGDLGPHEDNGHLGSDRTLCCRDCGAHFDA